ncbi:unnamed protein product [Cunninghamella echinulata]
MVEFNPATAGNIDEKGHVPTKEQAQLYDRQTQPTKKKRDLASASAITMTPPTQHQQQQHSAYSTHQTKNNNTNNKRKNNDDTTIQKKARTNANAIPVSGDSATLTPDNSMESHHRTVLMSIFLSDDSDNLLERLNNFSNMNVDLVLDEQGNTALHWAASLARLNTVEQLITLGADINKRNYSGETPLMRSVAATNSFDRDSFRKLLKLLESSLHISDNINRTVLHHTVLTAGIQGRVNAALYYMHHLLLVLEKLPASEKKSLIDKQDDQGDTALNIAARLDCTRMMELLIEAGADQTSENKLGLTVQDYMAKPSESSSSSASTSKTNQEVTNSDKTLKVPTSTLYSKRPTGSSQRGKEIITTIQKIVDALDEEYGVQLNEREEKLRELQDKLDKTTQELEAARKELEKRQEQSQLLAESQQKIRNLSQSLETGWAELEMLMKNNNQQLNKDEVLQFDVDQDIDSLFDIKSEQQGVKLEEGQASKNHILLLKARIGAYTLNNNALKTYLDGLRAETAEKELQCKRLIAACCNLSIDKIDDLVEPLTLAIESDPPDLDLARVIGFMEKIRRQGAFPTDDATDDITYSTTSRPPSTTTNTTTSTATTTIPNSSSSTSTVNINSPHVNSSSTQASTSYDTVSRNSNTSNIRNTSTQPF